MHQEKIHNKCFHCGDPCLVEIKFDNHDFCCEACRSVYIMLADNQLCDYYTYDEKAGIKPSLFSADKWEFLDNEDIVNALLKFHQKDYAIVVLSIPGMHCASCIYLLENLPTLLTGVISSEVNFLKKEITIHYNSSIVSLRKIVEKISDIGYPPSIQLANAEKDLTKRTDRQLIYRIGVAGFFSGNIMMLSLPEYFDLEAVLSHELTIFFRWLTVLLALPVLIYSAYPYFYSAYKAIRYRNVNMDLPIVIGISGLTIQSFYNIISGADGGYFDSITGLIFLLLIGRFFQQKTFDSLSFDRDYKYYFPIAIRKLFKDGSKVAVKVSELRKDDTIFIHHDELIPVDSILESAETSIDYAFVSGESAQIDTFLGSFIYAGGRNKGGKIRLKVVHEVSQSYLTKLWNAEAFKKQDDSLWGVWAKKSAGIFTVVVIVLAVLTGIYWYYANPEKMMTAVTSVLIVACPCVLALAIPFTFGSFLRVFSRNNFYLKNAESIEALASIDTIVFDKTGTLTKTGDIAAEFVGDSLSEYETSLVKTLTSSSMHPVSRAIYDSAEGQHDFAISNWDETLGAGISAEIDGNKLKLGNYKYADGREEVSEKATFLSVNGNIKGLYHLKYRYREDLKKLSQSLNTHFNLYLLSGDDDKDRGFLSQYFPKDNLFFGQKPQDKMDFIGKLKSEGKRVLMIGDGLNDAGALKISDFGITVTDDLNSFTPASDAILDAQNLGMLPQFTTVAKRLRRVLNLAFLFSAMYNIIGLSFAMRASLEPWVAAILMPFSSITVVIYTHLVTSYYAKKYKL